MPYIDGEIKGYLIEGYNYLGNLKKGDTIYYGFRPVTFNHYEIVEKNKGGSWYDSHHDYTEYNVKVNVYVDELEKPLTYKKSDDSEWRYDEKDYIKLAKNITVCTGITDDDLDMKRLERYFNAEEKRK